MHASRASTTRRGLLLGLGATGLVTARAHAVAADRPPREAAGARSAQIVTDGLIVGPWRAGRCDDSKVGIGVPRWDARTRRWLLWYYCRDRAFDPAAPKTLGTGRIALAISRDGLEWRRHDGAGALGSVLDHGTEPDYDALHLGLGDATWARDRWWLWCFGGNRTPRQTFAGALPGIGMLPGLATSRDGVRFTKWRGRGPGGALIDYRSEDDVFASWVNGLYEDDRFGLFYTTTPRDASTFRSWLTWSDDALSWGEPRELQWLDGARDWDRKGMMTRHVQRNFSEVRGRWLMAYTALHGDKARNMERSIGLAVSDDLLNWRHVFDEPILTIGAPGAWDSGGVSAPQLLKVGRELRLYYFGFPPPAAEERLPKGVGLAISRDRQLRRFERFASTAAA